MMRLTRPLFFILIVCFTGSCEWYSNEIYWNAERHSVISRHNKGITQLNIENDSTLDGFRLYWKGERGKPPGEIDFDSLHSDFEVRSGGKVVHIHAIRLRPNSNYMIQRYSNGDRGPFYLGVRTDSLGIIHVLEP